MVITNLITISPKKEIKKVQNTLLQTLNYIKPSNQKKFTKEILRNKKI